MPDPAGRAPCPPATAAWSRAAAGCRTGARRRAATGSRTTGRAATTASASTGGERTHADRLGLSAEHEGDAAFGIELDHLAGGLVDGPHVVLRIDAQADRGVEAVDILSELAHELAGGIELEEPRAAARERAVVANRRVGMSRARVDEDLALGVGADAADFADEDVVGRLEQVGVRRERQVRNAGLREDRGAAGENGRDGKCGECA